MFQFDDAIIVYKNGKLIPTLLTQNLLSLKLTKKTKQKADITKSDAYANEIRYYCVKESKMPTKVSPESLSDMLDILKSL